MIINENTKIMARLHTETNNRGLNIYNPYFKETNTNALYLLFKNEDPKPLINGIRNLNLAGAISAGFEHNAELPTLLDELSEVSKQVGAVGIIMNKNGKLKGHYQAGEGLFNAINIKFNLEGKKIVIFGAGKVAKAFLLHLKKSEIKPSQIEIYNRTLSHAKDLSNSFKNDFKIDYKKVSDMNKSSGGIFINATRIGSPWNKGEDYKFTNDFVKNFEFIADVTFVPLEPQLIKLAEELKIPNSPGWEMFLYQGKVCLEKILGIDVDTKILSKYIRADFEKNWV